MAVRVFLVAFVSLLAGSLYAQLPNTFRALDVGQFYPETRNGLHHASFGFRCVGTKDRVFGDARVVVCERANALRPRRLLVTCADRHGCVRVHGLSASGVVACRVTALGGLFCAEFRVDGVSGEFVDLGDVVLVSRVSPRALDGDRWWNEPVSDHGGGVLSGKKLAFGGGVHVSGVAATNEITFSVGAENRPWKKCARAQVGRYGEDHIAVLGGHAFAWTDLPWFRAERAGWIPLLMFPRSFRKSVSFRFDRGARYDLQILNQEGPVSHAWVDVVEYLSPALLSEEPIVRPLPNCVDVAAYHTDRHGHLSLRGDSGRIYMVIVYAHGHLPVRSYWTAGTETKVYLAKGIVPVAFLGLTPGDRVRIKRGGVREPIAGFCAVAGQDSTVMLPFGSYDAVVLSGADGITRGLSFLVDGLGPVRVDLSDDHRPRITVALPKGGGAMDGQCECPVSLPAWVSMDG